MVSLQLPPYTPMRPLALELSHYLKNNLNLSSLANVACVREGYIGAITQSDIRGLLDVCQFFPLPATLPDWNDGRASLTPTLFSPSAARKLVVIWRSRRSDRQRVWQICGAQPLPRAHHVFFVGNLGFPPNQDYLIVGLYMLDQALNGLFLQALYTCTSVYHYLAKVLVPFLLINIYTIIFLNMISRDSQKHSRFLAGCNSNKPICQTSNANHYNLELRQHKLHKAYTLLTSL